MEQFWNELFVVDRGMNTFKLNIENIKNPTTSIMGLVGNEDIEEVITEMKAFFNIKHNIYYKDAYVTIIETKEDEYNWGVLLDSNGNFIQNIGMGHMEITRVDLKHCTSEVEIAEYLVECGIVDCYFTTIEDMEKLHYFENYGYDRGTDAEVLKMLANDDYINKIGNVYIRVV